MGYNVSHFFFDNSCATILGNCPVVSVTIVWIISSRSCEELRSLHTANSPGTTYFTTGR